MTTFPFATMTQAEANGFSVEVDFVSFATTAAALRARDLGSSFELTAQGKTLTFPFSLDRIAYDNFTFSDGSQFLIGDADIQTFADPTSNLVNGTSGADYISGRGGDDEINGQAGADVIYGNQGADRITGTTGADTVFGGQGADAINYTGAADGVSIYGNLGADTLAGGDAADLIFGGQDDDRISGNGGTDRITAGLGNDIVYGNAGRDTIYGGDGNDALYGGVGSDLIYGNQGSDSIAYVQSDGPPDFDTIYGGQGADFIEYFYARGFGNLVYGNLGNDIISMGSGDDTVYGGQGDDGIYDRNTSGNNVFFGGIGNDSIYVGGGNDFVSGGEGNDRITLDTNAQVARRLNAGRDIIGGDGGDDVILYGEALEGQYITGGSGNDYISGSTYAGDIIYGNQGNDTIYGGGGDNQIFGGAGDDQITVGDTTNPVGSTIAGGIGGDWIDLINSSGPDRIVQRLGDSGYVRSSTFDRTVSDTIVALRTGLDQIVTGIAGTDANYVEANASDHNAAQIWGEQQIAAGRTYAFAYVGEFSDGFLFMDLNGDRAIDSEVHLVAQGSGLNGFAAGDIV